MPFYAHINSLNVVDDVIVAEPHEINLKDDASSWIETCPDTRGGKWIDFETNEEGSGTPLRMNYAGIGMIYDSERDAFIAKKPADSFVLNEQTCQWEPPVPHPNDGLIYRWAEESLSWVRV